MNREYLVAGFSAAALLAACSAPLDRGPAQPKAGAPQAALRAPQVPAAPLLPPSTLEGYKKALAERVARSSAEVFDDPMPEVLKSIVVLDITIDRDGRLARVAVRRSNGHKALEERAMDSVRRASPFDAPGVAVRGRDGSVNFLETFLFRDDGRFRILSLVR